MVNQCPHSLNYTFVENPFTTLHNWVRVSFDLTLSVKNKRVTWQCGTQRKSPLSSALFQSLLCLLVNLFFCIVLA